MSAGQSEPLARRALTPEFSDDGETVAVLVLVGRQVCTLGTTDLLQDRSCSVPTVYDLTVSKWGLGNWLVYTHLSFCVADTIVNIAARGVASSGAAETSNHRSAPPSPGLPRSVCGGSLGPTLQSLRLVSWTTTRATLLR